METQNSCRKRIEKSDRARPGSAQAIAAHEVTAHDKVFLRRYLIG
jgi:hypothetical protein